MTTKTRRRGLGGAERSKDEEKHILLMLLTGGCAAFGAILMLAGY